MPIQYTLTDAGHKYGIDHMPVDSAQGSANQSTLGSTTSFDQSWQGEEPPIGSPSTITVNWSNGFQQPVAFTALSPESGTLTGTSLSRSGTGELLLNVTMNMQVDVNTFEVDLTNGLSSLMTGNDTVTGSAYNNKLRGFAGNDSIDGGAGADTAYYSGTRSQYQVSGNASTMTVSGPDGVDTLVNVERLQFSDKAVAFDVDTTAGQAYRLYQAAFDRQPDAGGLGTWINYMDSGHSLVEVSSMFQQSTEFVTKYGTSLSSSDFVTLLYQNVLHRAPDAGGLGTWTNLLDTNQWSRAQVLIGFSESTENKAALIGVMQAGMEFIPTV